VAGGGADRDGCSGMLALCLRRARAASAVPATMQCVEGPRQEVDEGLVACQDAVQGPVRRRADHEVQVADEREQWRRGRW
jgi:hypothetical protein